MSRVLRASSLPTFQQCPRMAAANTIPDLIREAGFEIPTERNSVAAAVGHALHAWIAIMLKRKRDTGAAKIDRAMPEEVVAEFDKEMSDGGKYDETTGGPSEALEQIHQMARSFAYYVLPYSQPKLVEAHLRANLGDGWELSGHVDEQEVDNVIIDWKSSMSPRPKPFQAQMGTYAVLVNSQPDTEPAADVCRVGGFQRVKCGKPQPEPVIVEYNTNDCERLAWSLIDRVKESVGRFEKTGDPYEFTPNPSSNLCNFCPVKGTPFCTFGK